MIESLTLNTITKGSETIVLQKENSASTFTGKNLTIGLSFNDYAIYDNGLSKVKLFDNVTYVDNTDNDLDSTITVNPKSITKINTNNLFEFNISDLSVFPNLTELSLISQSSNNAITGDIKQLPPKLTKIEITAFNTLDLNVEDIPYNCTFFKIAGAGDFSTYNRRSWVSNMKTLSLRTTGGTGMSEAEVTNLLEDLSETSWQANGLVEILGNHDSTPTSSMQPFIDELNNKGVTVNLNTLISID